MVVLLGFIKAPSPFIIPPSNPNPIYLLYLPLAIKGDTSNSLVDFVEIGVFDNPEYGGETCLSGYTIGNTPTAVYSVTLAIDVEVHGYYCLNSECPPIHETHYGKPMLDATLPDQKNPFYYCLIHTKGWYEYGAVKLDSASLNPPNGRITYPLTVKSWTKQGNLMETTVSGIVRNDSGHSLAEIRVVGIAGACSPKEAELRSTRLGPGEETSFIFNQFFCQYFGMASYPEMLEISAQGVVKP